MALLLGTLGACTTPPAPTANPHYVLGPAYQAHGIWWYPNESYDLDDTGLATVLAGDAPRLTTDGEVFDQTALAASHPTLPLPTIARLTNLENGLEVTVRVNDRGSGHPARLMEITRRTAELLRVARDGVVRVRLRVLARESHAAADALPGAPSLHMVAAPRGTVHVAELPPAAGVRLGRGHTVVADSGGRDVLPLAAPPMRLPEVVTQTPPAPGVLMLRLDTFDEFRYAAIQRAKMSSFSAKIVPLSEGRVQRFRVEVGPLPDTAQADAALMQALASGIPDARIVVD